MWEAWTTEAEGEETRRGATDPIGARDADSGGAGGASEADGHRWVVERSLRLLEYGAVLARVAGLARTDLGRERVLALRPAHTQSEAELLLGRTREADGLLLGGKALLYGVHDLRTILVRAERGGTLSAPELFAVLETVRGLRSTREAVLARGEDTPLLALVVAGITVEQELEERLAPAVDEEGVLDGASPTLAAIRREMKAVANRMRDTLERYIRDRELGRYLQEALITQRAGRYVLPVRAEHRAQVPGIVHDVSSSGATVFVEPQAVVELGNRLQELTHAEAKEIERVLRALTALVGRRAGSLRDSLAAAATLDLHLALAEQGRLWDGTLPELGGEEIRIRRGRHPLLGEGAVPLDLTLPASTRALVITGPNTGGKTVALKTVALFVLLAESGFPLPAETGTRVPFFANVYADIGDEQSIEQSLSTFSSHMGAIARILADVDADSLVVLDEIGAGTDPAEGAALALAILEHLVEVGARVLVTTHFAELKAVADRDPRVQNASVAFDAETLRPTYRLVQGRPGFSNALHIAARLGLPETVLARARDHLGPERVATGDLLLRLRALEEAATEEQRRAEELRRALETRLAAAEAREAAAREEARLLRERAREEAREFVRQAKHELRRLMQEARQRAAEAEGPKALDQVREAVRAWDERTVREPRRVQGRPADVRPGEAVEIVSLGQRGRVVEVRGEEALVEVGMLRVAVPRGDLRVVAGSKDTVGGGWSGTTIERAASVRPELDLRGLESTEAIELLDKYLDDALLAGLGEVRIIHGKGTGALRAAVARFLRGHPAVAEFRLGRYGEGEDGVTVVTLRPR